MSALGDALQPPCGICGGKWTAQHRCGTCQCGHDKTWHPKNGKCRRRLWNSPDNCPCLTFKPQREPFHSPSIDLNKGDMVSVTIDNQTRVYRVVTFENGCLTLDPIQHAKETP